MVKGRVEDGPDGAEQDGVVGAVLGEVKVSGALGAGTQYCG